MNSEPLASETLDAQPTKDEAKQTQYKRREALIVEGKVGTFFRSYGFIIAVVAVLVFFAGNNIKRLFFPSETVQSAETRQPIALREPPKTINADLQNSSAQSKKTTETAFGHLSNNISSPSSDTLTQKPTVSDKTKTPDMALVMDDFSPRKKPDAALILGNNAAASNDIKQHVDKLDAKMKNLDAKMEKIDAAVTDMKQSVMGLTKTLDTFKQKQSADERAKINALQTSVQTLSERMMSLDKQIKQQAVFVDESVDETQANQLGESPAQMAQPVNQAFKVEAIIPGRAWLVNQDGVMFTVALGDTLGNLGQVVTIDSVAGAVVTSNGTVIKEGSH